MRAIIKNLFQGDASDAEKVAREKAGIDWIVYLGQELPEKLMYKSKVPVIHIPLADGADLKLKWDIAVDFIDYCLKRFDSDNKVLVACRQGISRSPMMVVYYLMNHTEAHDFDTVVKIVADKIPDFRPEQNLFKLLRRWTE